MGRDYFPRLVFPQFALGGGYEMSIALANPGDSEWQGALALRQAKEAPWTGVVKLNGQDIASGADTVLTLAPKETKTLTFTGDEVARAGYLLLSGRRSFNPAVLTVSFRYRLIRPGGEFQDSVAVAASESHTKASFVVERGVSHDTGIAIAPASLLQDFSLRFRLFDALGNSLQQKEMRFNGHTALFFTEIFDLVPPEFVGHVELETEVSVHLLVLRMDLTKDGVQLTIVPTGP